MNRLKLEKIHIGYDEGDMNCCEYAALVPDHPGCRRKGIIVMEKFFDRTGIFHMDNWQCPDCKVIFETPYFL